MLAPLIRWRSPNAMSNDFPETFCIGRGQILGIHGPDWRDFFSLLQDPAALGETGHALAEIQDGESLTDCCDRMTRPDSPPLWMISLKASFTSVQLRQLQGLLEKLGRQGGGAVVAADSLPSGMPFTQTLAPPLPGQPMTEFGDLVDDQGMPVNFLRQGEWGALRFNLGGKLPLGPLDAARLKISGNDNGWNSEPMQLESWKSLAPTPGRCIVSFSAPWEPGNYTACLVFSGTGRKRREQSAEIRFKIRPSGVNPIPDGRQVRWRFTGSPPLPRRLVQLNLSAAPSPRMNLSEANRGELLRGWHDAEPHANNQFRRWTKGRAAAILGGRGNRLRITLDDFRPRSAPGNLTRLKLQVDDLAPTITDWHLPGRQVVDIAWPDDGLNHQLNMEITPAWSPKNINLSEDSRELGVLVYSLKVFHGQ